MINGFQEWATSNGVLTKYSLSELSDRGLAIHAEEYINKIFLKDSEATAREPLLSALGGIPFIIETTIDSHIKILRELNIKVIFVFNGLDPNSQTKNLTSSLEHSKNSSEAWDLYNDSDPEEAVTKFGNSCMLASTFQKPGIDSPGNSNLDNIYRHVQSYFHQQNVNFIVGPYSALAQVSMSTYLIRHHNTDTCVAGRDGDAK